MNFDGKIRNIWYEVNKMVNQSDQNFKRFKAFINSSYPLSYFEELFENILSQTPFLHA